MLDYVIDQLVHMDVKDQPNILLHGCEGVSHSYIVEQFIMKRFKLTTPLHKRYPVWNGLAYIETDYYIEIDCFHPDFTDVLLELLITISKHKCIHLNRHIIFIRNIDYFHKNNSQSLRVLFERFSNNVLFICSTRHINKIEKPLQSRMQLYRIPLRGKPALRKKEAPLPLDLTDKESIRKCAFKLFQQDVTLSELIKAVLPKINEDKKVEFISIATNIEHQSVLCDPSKLAFHIEHLLHELKGFVT